MFRVQPVNELDCAGREQLPRGQRAVDYYYMFATGVFSACGLGIYLSMELCVCVWWNGVVKTLTLYVSGESDVFVLADAQINIMGFSDKCLGTCGRSELHIDVMMGIVWIYY